MLRAHTHTRQQACQHFVQFAAWHGCLSPLWRRCAGAGRRCCCLACRRCAGAGRWCCCRPTCQRSPSKLHHERRQQRRLQLQHAFHQREDAELAGGIFLSCALQLLLWRPLHKRRQTGAELCACDAAVGVRVAKNLQVGQQDAQLFGCELGLHDAQRSDQLGAVQVAATVGIQFCKSLPQDLAALGINQLAGQDAKRVFGAGEVCIDVETPAASNLQPMH
mmetsp:Transcript_9328/g.28439  ORF Transcript_9328/g.28439 Transcript_9328/m.28439 type:complete len:220 (-) Transcript_9328:5053-5712(-)